MTAWKDPEARKLRRKILSTVNTRIASNLSRPATIRALRESLQWAPDAAKREGENAYGKPWHKLTADELFQISYALQWANAYGKRVSDYFCAGFHDPIGNATETTDLFA